MVNAAYRENVNPLMKILKSYRNLVKPKKAKHKRVGKFDFVEYIHKKKILNLTEIIVVA